MITPVSKYFTNPKNSTCVITREGCGINEISDWADENCKGLFTQKGGLAGNIGFSYYFYFNNKDDAMNFKLFWG